MVAYRNRLGRLLYPPEKVCPLTYVERLVGPKIIPNYQQKIPFIVWQTWKTVHLPPRMARVIRQFRDNNPEYTHHLFTDIECANFIEEFFSGTKIEQAYFRINPEFGAARADFWRYCVLFQHGGVYLDIDSTCLKPLRDFIGVADSAILSQEKNLVERWREDLELLGDPGFLSDPPARATAWSSNVFLQWLLFFEPKHPLLAAVIENVADAVLAYREFEPSRRPTGHIRTIYLTGPLRFTNTIWVQLKKEPSLICQLHIDGIDFQGKAIFQFPGHTEKERQSKHYSKLQNTFIASTS